MCQKESVGFPGLEQIGTYVWGCGNGYCDHGPGKPKMTVYHVIWLIRIRIKKIFGRLIPFGDSSGLRRRHCVSSHCGLQQKSKKKLESSSKTTVVLKRYRKWATFVKSWCSPPFTPEVLGDGWCSLGLTGSQERFAWCSSFEDELQWICLTDQRIHSHHQEEIYFVSDLFPQQLNENQTFSVLFFFFFYVWLEPKAQSNDLTPYNLDRMS